MGCAREYFKECGINKAIVVGMSTINDLGKVESGASRTLIQQLPQTFIGLAAGQSSPDGTVHLHFLTMLERQTCEERNAMCATLAEKCAYYQRAMVSSLISHMVHEHVRYDTKDHTSWNLCRALLEAFNVSFPIIVHKGEPIPA